MGLEKRGGHGTIKGACVKKTWGIHKHPLSCSCFFASLAVMHYPQLYLAGSLSVENMQNF